MNKKIIKLSGALFVLAIAYIGFAIFFFDPIEMQVYKSKSPTGYGEAIFVERLSIKDTITDFYVSNSTGNIKKIPINTFDSDERALQEIVWSGDGSVIAARGTISQAGKDYGAFFTCAYDFKKQSVIRPSSSSYSIRPLSRKIKQLLKSRGGQRLGKITDFRVISGWKWYRREYE